MLSQQPGSHNWAAAFAAVPETEVVAVFDRGAETREQFLACWSQTWPAVSHFDDYDRMLAETRPDLVCIATRQTVHADQIERAVAAGARGILSDKPLATTLGETERIVAACRGAKIPVAFGLDRRWTARYRWARDLLAGGAIGRITAVTAYGLINLINHGCHWYDVALMLVGDPEVSWVSGFVDHAESTDSNKHLDPTGRALVGLANGVMLHVTPDGRPGPAFEVLGDSGRLLLLNDARDAYLWTAAASTPDRPRSEPVTVPETTAPWEAGPALVHDLLDAMRTNRPTACDVDHARRATEIGFAIHASSALAGRKLSIAEVDPNLRIESFKWGNE